MQGYKATVATQEAKTVSSAKQLQAYVASPEPTRLWEKTMNMNNTLNDPCPCCGQAGHIRFVREVATEVAGITVGPFMSEYFVCDECHVEFSTPDCFDPLELLAPAEKGAPGGCAWGRNAHVALQALC